MSPAELKKRITLEDELDHRGLTASLKRKPSALVGPCPIHGGDNPTAFSVDTRKQLWHCFTRCAQGGDIFDLVRALDQVSFLKILAYLERRAGKHEQVMSPAPVFSKLFQPFTKTLRLDPIHPFLQGKGITPETAKNFEAGYYHGCGFLEKCVAVRLFDPGGNPLGYAGRRLEPLDIERFGKWKFPLTFPKRNILFNHNRLKRNKPVFLVECPWGVMRLAQLGFQAVAVLGTALSTTQNALLRSYPKVFVLFDGDLAGRKGAWVIAGTLKTKTLTTIIPLPDGIDPDDLEDEKLQGLLDPFVSF